MIKNIIKMHESRLTKIDKKISQYLLKNYNLKTFNMSITKLAEKIEVSPSAITRFCQRIELPSFPTLQMKCINELNSVQKYEGVDDDLKDIIYSLSRTSEIINKDSIKLIAKKIIQTNNVYIYGESFTMVLADQFKRKLNKINIQASSFNVASDLGLVLPKKHSTHILVSMSGMNPNIKRAAKKLDQKTVGQTIFSIGSSKYSNINDYVNEHIGGEYFQNNEQHPIELPSVASIVSEFILNKIFKEVYQYNADKNKALIMEVQKEKRK
ncbi:MurR/RpiR family transcriptional regulator [Mycoplasma todarodis]|uniref:MurR/RpiR family transcriptional regulator n=1 Tax=Mycoplasma todarodis TaxID=1937191 RepID=UPI003B2D8278